MLALATRVNEVGYLIGTIYSLLYLYSHWNVLGGIGFLLMIFWNPLAFLLQVFRLFAQLLCRFTDLFWWERAQQRDVVELVSQLYPNWAAPMSVLRFLCGIAAMVAGPLLVWCDCHVVVLWSSMDMVLFLIMPASFTLFLALFEALVELMLRRLWLPSEYFPVGAVLNSGGFAAFSPHYKKHEEFEALLNQLWAEGSECDEEIDLCLQSEKLIRLE